MNNKKQRNKLFTMLMLVMALLIPQWGWAQEIRKPSVGDGSTGNPYEISTAAELAWFRTYVNEGNLSVCAKLTDNIDLKDFCHAADASNNIEKSWEPIGSYDSYPNKAYKGVFDGNGHTISNLYIKVQREGVGFFGCASGSIKNITFDNAQVENTGNDYNYSMTGIVVGAGFATLQNLKTLNNCSVKSGAKSLGGIAGNAKNCSNLENNATVIGVYEVGGIVGVVNSNATLSSCVNNGMVTENRSGRCGGIVGSLYKYTIEDCANYGNVTGTKEIGGIVGYAYGNSTIKRTLSSGDITSQESSAGIIVGNAASIKASNMLAYSNNAKLTIKGTVQEGDNIKTVGEGNLGIASGSTLEEIIKGFTQEQLKSGEVAFSLNSFQPSGSWAWYQKLGENGDAYPVLTSTGENTVYGAYHHGEKDRFFSNTVIANQHSVAYNAEAEDEVNGNHDLSYEAGEYTWTEAEDKTQVPSVAVTYTCKVCGKTETPHMTVEHDAEHNDEAATCTEDGHKYYKTSYAFNAKAIFSNAYTQTLPALGHNMSEDVTFNDSKSIYQKGCTRNCGHNEYFATSDASVAAQPNDDTSAFTVDKFTLNDATAYDSKAEFTVTNLEYKRSFSHDKWLAVYVPFSIDCGQLTEEYEMATINNFHEFEQKDGKYNIVLEVKPVTNGTTIPALTPCLIRMKQAPETAEAETTEAKTLQFTNVSFAAAADKKIDCASVTRYYQFLGTLNAKVGFDTTSDFVINEGELWKAGSDTELNPQRWYLNASDRTGSELNPSVQLSRIAIHVIGGDETTDIDGIYVKTDTEDVSSTRQGIYDLQGRKLSEEPTSGIYIKDGKKYVK